MEHCYGKTWYAPPQVKGFNLTMQLHRILCFPLVFMLWLFDKESLTMQHCKSGTYPGVCLGNRANMSLNSAHTNNYFPSWGRLLSTYCWSIVLLGSLLGNCKLDTISLSSYQGK